MEEYLKFNKQNIYRISTNVYWFTMPITMPLSIIQMATLIIQLNSRSSYPISSFQSLLVTDTTLYNLLFDTISCKNEIGLTQGPTLAIEEVRQLNYCNTNPLKHVSIKDHPWRPFLTLWQVYECEHGVHAPGVDVQQKQRRGIPTGNPLFRNALFRTVKRIHPTTTSVIEKFQIPQTPSKIWTPTVSICSGSCATNFFQSSIVSALLNNNYGREFLGFRPSNSRNFSLPSPGKAPSKRFLGRAFFFLTDSAVPSPGTVCWNILTGRALKNSVSFVE